MYLLYEMVVRNPEVAPDVSHLLRGAQIFDASNVMSVAPFPYEIHQQTPILSPYLLTWVEWQEDLRPVILRHASRALKSGEIEQEDVESLGEHFGPGRVKTKDGVLVERTPWEMGWRLRFYCFSNLLSEITEAAVFSSMSVFLDDQGLVIPVPQSEAVRIEFENAAKAGAISSFNEAIIRTDHGTLIIEANYEQAKRLTTEAIYDSYVGNTIRLVSYATFVLGLMNCKNIVQIDNGSSDEGKKKRNRHRGRMPSVKYKVLAVRPVVRRNPNKTVPNMSPHDSNPISLHFVRGHFKTFTPDAPLFGRWTGTYWWESQARGSIVGGIVNKDYDVQSE